eukprot:Skav214012  [mRNA]  locus=scaffold1070:372120:374923:- [translate_table: standard]
MDFIRCGTRVAGMDYPVDDTSDIRTGSSDGRVASGGLRGLDVIAKARQRIREVKERERLAKLREQEEAEQRRRDAQAQHEQRMKRQESERPWWTPWMVDHGGPPLVRSQCGDEDRQSAWKKNHKPMKKLRKSGVQLG